MLILAHSVVVQRSTPRGNTVRSDDIFQDSPPWRISMKTDMAQNYKSGEIGTPVQQATPGKNKRRNWGVRIVFRCSRTRGPSSFPESWTSAKQRVNRWLPTRRTLCTTRRVDLCTIGTLPVKTIRRMRSMLLSVGDPPGLG